MSWFENDVKEYGIQATTSLSALAIRFENDVKEYGIQAFNVYSNLRDNSLRMM